MAYYAKGRRKRRPSKPKDPFYRKRCQITGKVRFSKSEAKQARKSAGEGGGAIRPYQCHHCGDWHLTSDPRENWGRS